ncbi:glycosyltransferase family 87 protein [Salinifilum ghardaiensis]
MATVDVKPSRAVPEPGGGARTRLRGFVTRYANALIIASIPVLLGSMAVMMAWGRAGISEDYAIDYQVYRWAVGTWVSGGELVGNAPVVSTGQPLPWVYPPFALLPLAPFALLPFEAGITALFLVDLLAIGSTLYLVTRHMWPSVGARGAAAVAMSALSLTPFLEPVYSSFGLGQVNIVLMGLVAVDCLARSPRWPRGLLVGIAAAIKLTPAAFLLFFVINRRYRAAVVTVVTAAAGTLAGFAVHWKAAVAYWFGAGPASGVNGSAFHTNQSIRGALARLGMPESTELLLWGAACIVCVAIVAFAVHRLDPVLGVLATGLLALLISPTSWSDHWVWCAPALLVMIGHAVRGRSAGWSVVAAITLAVTVTATFTYVPFTDPWTKTQHLVGNPYFLWGAVLVALLGLRAWFAGPRSRGPAAPRSSVSAEAQVS